MNLYERYFLPRLIDLAMRNKASQAERARAIPRAAETVLEVGIGSGLNLPFYGRAVECLAATGDPSETGKLKKADRTLSVVLPLLPNPSLPASEEP
ncbi:MAG TPA: hypothetical protein VMS64_31860 [Candidatus Methylomirabilis sp.]|nr:hypothetical protein [Candidatus Methylomirabilis sp.]